MKFPILLRIHLVLIIEFCVLILGAQQLPLSTRQVLLSDPMNPGQIHRGVLNGAFFGIQQRTRQGSAWGSSSQFLHFHGRPQGRKGIFRWGANIVNDIDHTEHRLSMTPTVSVQLLSKPKTQIHVGVLAGFVAWSSNYQGRLIYDIGDPVASDQMNLIEVNSGLGGSFRHKSDQLMMEGGAWINQLSGNLVSSPLEGIRLFPSLKAECSMLFPVSEGILVGPRMYYQDVIGDTVQMGPGRSHIGALARIPDRGIWVAATASMAPKVFNLGFGFPLIVSKMNADPLAFNQSLDLNVGVLYPMGISDGFGPSIELGVVWNFGRNKTHGVNPFPPAKPFWSDEPSLVRHKQQHLDSIGPPDLQSNTKVHNKNVFLEFKFLDRSRQYAGTYLVFKEGMVYRAGSEWEGVDGLAWGIINRIIEPALNPDTTRVRDPENLEALHHLAWVEVSCQLRDNNISANNSSEVIYEGELGTNDSLNTHWEIPIVYDDRDTVVRIYPGKYMSNLQLAAMKLCVIRDRIQYELEEVYGKTYNVIREETLTKISKLEEAEDWRIKIIVKTPRITSDNSNLQGFQRNSILLKFPRDPEFWPSEDEGGVPVNTIDTIREKWELSDEEKEEE